MYSRMVLMLVCWRYGMPCNANDCVSSLVSVDWKKNECIFALMSLRLALTIIYFLVMISKMCNCPWNIAYASLYVQYMQDRVATEWTRVDREGQTGDSPSSGNLSPTFGEKSKICQGVVTDDNTYSSNFQTIHTDYKYCAELCTWVKDKNISATPSVRSHTGHMLLGICFQLICQILNYGAFHSLFLKLDRSKYRKTSGIRIETMCQ